MDMPRQEHLLKQKLARQEQIQGLIEDATPVDTYDQYLRIKKIMEDEVKESWKKEQKELKKMLKEEAREEKRRRHADPYLRHTSKSTSETTDQLEFGQLGESGSNESESTSEIPEFPLRDPQV